MKCSILLTLCAALTFSGCARTVYVDRPVEVYVPVPCKVPKAKCTTKEERADMNASAVVESAYQCILIHEENEKVCN